ncbi:LysE family translocator [Burkholderiaceae bacterium DAT-1]|nr:LysE family translocator [Burkholderiaceae bacterium DAT-1]
MSFENYFAFLVAASLLIFSPGPVNVLAMSEALSSGWKRAMSCVWGAAAAMILQLIVTGVGLSSLLALLGGGLDVLRWIGAAYLIYLGYQQYKARGLVLDQPVQKVRRRTLWWKGFAISGMNPKTLLFFPSFFPQFLNANAAWSIHVQFTVLAATFTALFVIGVGATAMFSHQFRSHLADVKKARGVNRVLGGMLVMMGVMLAASK